MNRRPAQHEETRRANHARRPGPEALSHTLDGLQYDPAAPGGLYKLGALAGAGIVTVTFGLSAVSLFGEGLIIDALPTTDVFNRLDDGMECIDLINDESIVGEPVIEAVDLAEDLHDAGHTESNFDEGYDHV